MGAGRGRVCGIGEEVGLVGEEVGFVGEEDEVGGGVFGEEAVEFLLLGEEGGGGVEEPDYNTRFLHAVACSLYADVLHYVVRLTESGSVNEAVEDTVNLDGVLDGVAGGAGNVTHNGFVIVEQ